MIAQTKPAAHQHQPAPPEELHRLSYRISEFCLAAGIGRTRAYEEIAAGRLRVVKFGRSTLVLAADAQAFLANLRGAA